MRQWGFLAGDLFVEKEKRLSGEGHRDMIGDKCKLTGYLLGKQSFYFLSMWQLFQSKKMVASFLVTSSLTISLSEIICHEHSRLLIIRTCEKM